MPEIRVPSESSLVMQLHQLTDVLRTGVMSVLWWCDTLAMISDGSKKVAVEREPLIYMPATGQWVLVSPALAHREPHNSQPCNAQCCCKHS